MTKDKSVQKTEQEISPIYAMSGFCFGVQCYRGFAPLSILARMSMPDEYHQTQNPTGTQRGLSPKHAREAYDYAKNNYKSKNALWPEIILNIRNDCALRADPKAQTKGPRDANLQFVKIQINWSKIQEAKDNQKILVSRVDGNHRLFFADGDKRRKLGPLNEVYSPFCIMKGVSPEAERLIFMKINCEQKRLNISHLLRIEQQLTPDSDLLSKNKPLWLTGKLHEDSASPFYQQVDKGGKKGKGDLYLIKQKSLLDGITQLLKNFPKHPNIPSETLLRAIINYFTAVKEVWDEEWKDNKNYKLMTNTGMQALGTIGGRLMETLSATYRLKKEDFSDQLAAVNRQYSDFWHVKSTCMEGKSGRPGAQKIADDMYEIISEIDSSKIEV
jgi:DGQHR domain-containing protein